MVKKKWLNEFLSDKYVKDANREGFSLEQPLNCCKLMLSLAV